MQYKESSEVLTNVKMSSVEVMTPQTGMGRVGGRDNVWAGSAELGHSQIPVSAPMGALELADPRVLSLGRETMHKTVVLQVQEWRVRAVDE